MWEMINANPLVILAISLVVITLTGRALVQGLSTALNSLITTVTTLAESTAKNAENVDQLTDLYKTTVIDTAKAVDRQEHNLSIVLQKLDDIEKLIQDTIDTCKEKEKNNGTSN